MMRSVDDVRAMIAGSGGPRSNGVTQAATVRLHDDKSTYTGAGIWKHLQWSQTSRSGLCGTGNPWLVGRRTIRQLWSTTGTGTWAVLCWNLSGKPCCCHVLRVMG